MLASIPPLRMSRVRASATSLATMGLRGTTRATTAALWAIWTTRSGPIPRALRIVKASLDAERYSQLGEVLATLALERCAGTSSSTTTNHGRIEEAIARRIEEFSEGFSEGQDFGREEILDYLHGERWPKPEFIRAFAQAFSLTVVELRLLAWAYTFSETPPPRIAQHPPPVIID
jgi:hypothetical protein